MSKCHVVIILDRSGSMGSIREATVKGINQLIEDTQKIPGEGTWTLIQFDDHASAKGAGESFPHVVFEQVPDRRMPRLEVQSYLPRGGTALVDAVCASIERMKEKVLSSLDPSKERVMLVIVTDGQENASREYTSERLRELTAECQSKYGWQFIYLGANQDEFAEAGKLGIVAPMNYPGMGGVYGSGAGFNFSSMPFTSTERGVRQAILSGSFAVRAWKADGNETAMGLLTPCPEPVAVETPEPPTSGAISCSGIQLKFY